MVTNLQDLLAVATTNDDGFDHAQVSKPGLTVVIGGCNIHAHSAIQISGESLSAIANILQLLPPESVAELTGPLTDLIKAAGVAVSKVSH
jgi:hypothetical protein